MNVFILYAAIAVVCAVAASTVAEWSREPGIPAPDHPYLLAAIAGLLWPVLLVGAIQIGLWVLVRNRARAATAPVSRPHSEPRVRVGAGSAA